MWDLDYKESWAPKNWCFWTVVLEKTLESPLDCKEIQPVRPKGNQSWIFIGRTDVEAETPILWPPDVKNWLMRKDWFWERVKAGGEGDDREWDGWMASPSRWTWVWVNSGSWWWTGRPGVLQSMGSQRFGHDRATELYIQGIDDIPCMPCMIKHNYIKIIPHSYWTSLVTQMASILPAMQDTQVQCLGQEDILEKWKQSTPLLLLGEFHGQRSLVGYSSWGCKESVKTEWLTHTHSEDAGVQAIFKLSSLHKYNCDICWMLLFFSFPKLEMKQQFNLPKVITL